MPPHSRTKTMLRLYALRSPALHTSGHSRTPRFHLNTGLPGPRHSPQTSIGDAAIRIALARLADREMRVSNLLGFPGGVGSLTWPYVRWGLLRPRIIAHYRLAHYRL